MPLWIVCSSLQIALDCINSCFSTWDLHYLVLEKIMGDLFFCLKAIKQFGAFRTTAESSLDWANRGRKSSSRFVFTFARHWRQKTQQGLSFAFWDGQNQDLDVSWHFYLFLKPQALQLGSLPSLAFSLLPSLPHRILYLVLVSHFHISIDCIPSADYMMPLIITKQVM